VFFNYFDVLMLKIIFFLNIILIFSKQKIFLKTTTITLHAPKKIQFVLSGNKKRLLFLILFTKA